jgi:hypothetical protein
MLMYLKRLKAVKNILLALFLPDKCKFDLNFQ